MSRHAMDGWWWYYPDPEGTGGPYDTKEEAEKALEANSEEEVVVAVVERLRASLCVAKCFALQGLLVSYCK